MDAVNRRHFLQQLATGAAGLAVGAGWAGCRGHQVGHVLNDNQSDMVGSHQAGAETFNPLVDDAVGQLLGRHMTVVQPASHPVANDPRFETLPPGIVAPQRICFVGVENKSAEDLGDFKEQIYQQIDTRIVQSQQFRPISRRFVEAGLRETRLLPDELFLPRNRELFAAALEQQGQPFDYLLYATLTTGTTQKNQRDYQRDYLLTMEMIDIRSGDYDKQTAEVRKGYHRSKIGKALNYNPLSRKG